MGAAVSLQYFPVDFRKLGLFRLNETAGTLDKPIVATRLARQGQLPVVVQRQPMNPPVSTAPYYLAATQSQSAAIVEIDRAEALPNTLIAGDGKADGIRQSRLTNTQAGRLQGSKQSEVPGMRRPKTIRQLDKNICQAIEALDAASLGTLLDAHPHAGPDPADNSVGTFILHCFRKVASWFNSAASAWQGTQAVALLNKAARAGNAEVIQILLDRGMDLAKDKPMVEPALRIVVTSGNAEATTLLLGEVLRMDPGYCRNAELTRKAARAGHADVLEVLVEQGMALPPANSWPHYGQIIEGYLRWFAAGKTGKWSGFTAETVKTLVEKLDAAVGRHIPQRADSAPAVLAQGVMDAFERITASGDIRTDLLEHLVDQGMYGLVAGMVVNAATLAAASPLWNAPDANRRVLFAEALERSAGELIDVVQQLRDASGDPDLFDQLLSPQLELLIAYEQSCRALSVRV